MVAYSSSAIVLMAVNVICIFNVGDHAPINVLEIVLDVVVVFLINGTPTTNSNVVSMTTYVVL